MNRYFANPVVTVIVPCYNYAHYLPMTLDSIIAQTLATWECIIVDDGSTDHTKDVALAYARQDERIRYIYQENKGLSAARNTGLKKARGRFAQLLDADDLIEPQKLELQVYALENDRSIDIHYGISKFFFNDNAKQLYLHRSRANTSWMPMVSGTRSNLLPELIKWNIMAVSCPLIRVEVFKIVGFFDEKLKSLEDWDYWLRCALANVKMTFAEGDNLATHIRISANSMMSNNLVMQLSEVKVRKKIRRYIKAEVGCVSVNENAIRNMQNILFKKCKKSIAEKKINNVFLMSVSLLRLEQWCNLGKYIIYSVLVKVKQSGTD